MSASRTLSATEKLLERIRSDAGSLPHPPIKSSPFFSLPGQGQRTVGISFSPDAIFMVEAVRTRKECRFTRHARFPLSTAPDPSSLSFAEALRKALLSFIGKGRNMNIWVLMGAADVEIRLLALAPVSEKELPQAVFWALKKELGPEFPKDPVYDFALVGRRMEEGRLRLEVLVCYGKKAGLEPLSRLFSSLGYRLSGITIASFAYENLLREGRMGKVSQGVCTLFVGAGWSRIDVFQGRHIRLSRDIKTGFNSLVEVIQEEMKAVMAAAGEAAEPPFELAVSMVETIVEGEPIRWEIRGREYGIEDGRLRELGQPVLLRLIRQVERTLEYYTLNFKGEPASLLYLSGNMVRNPRLMRALSRQFTLPVKALDPFAEGDFAGEDAPPEAIAERDQMIPAAGLALSSEKTPNLFFTWKERREARRNRRLTLMVGLLGLVFMGLLSVYTGLEQGRLERQREKNQEMEARMAGFATAVTPEMLTSLQQAYTGKGEKIRKRAERYAAIAMVGEILRRTQEPVYLQRIFWEKKKEKTRGGELPCIEVEGHILHRDDGGTPESLLAAYGLNLSQAPFFLGTRVRKQEMRDGVLVFSLSVECHGELTP